MKLSCRWISSILSSYLFLGLVQLSAAVELKGDANHVRQASPGSAPSPVQAGVKGQTKGSGCYKGDLVCEKDKLGYEAISTLHHQMDDDQNGDIDLEESAEFLIEELQYGESHWSEHRRKAFHMNDTHITVDDLWSIWKNSSVHNWTIDQVVLWLTNEVELPQYSETFKMNAVDGSTLPRLAVNNLNFVSNILGIRNLVHKQKLANKATDVVLFGPPKSRHNWYKDVALVTAIAVAAGGCWFAYRQNRQLEINMARTMRDMDSLARSEMALKELQERLESEELEKRRHILSKEQLEQQIQHEISEARLEAQKLKLTKEETETQLSSQFKQTRAELERTKEALTLAQKELEVRSSLSPSIELQKWLQITYELELKAYNEKKSFAEQQLMNAKDSCERLRKKRQALFGSLRMANSGSIDETENIIITARKALEEVKHDLAERQYRWQQVENLCPFSIVNNPGIKSLIQNTGLADLYRYCHGGTLLEATSPDLDDLDDVPPTYVAVLAGPSSCTSSTSKSSLSNTKHLFRGQIAKPPSNGAQSTDSLSRGGSEEPPPSTSDTHDDVPLDDPSLSPTNQSSAQPQFSLCGEDAESSSSSDNSNIPRSRPRLVRHTALTHTSDNMSVCSEQAPSSSSSHIEALRPRTNTHESMPTLRSRRAQTVNSPLSHSADIGSNGSLVVNASSSIKRSCTTDLQVIKARNAAMNMSASTGCLTKPGSAPASLITQQDDSDTSLSSGSKDSVSERKKKVKAKKKVHIMNIFKMKQRTS